MPVFVPSDAVPRHLYLDGVSDRVAIARRIRDATRSFGCHVDPIRGITPKSGS